MIDQFLILIIIAIGFILIVGGTRLLGKAVGCVLAPFKFVFKIAIALVVAFVVLSILINQMGKGPLLNIPLPRVTSQPKATIPLPTPSAAHTPQLPGQEWEKEEFRPGLWYAHNNKYKGNIDVHVYIIDLTSPYICFKTLIGEGDGVERTRTSELAKRNGAIAATNADYFGDPKIGPEGTTIIEGNVIRTNPPLPGPRGRSALVFGKTGGAGTHVEIGLWKKLCELPDKREGWMYNAVGGGPILVVDGKYQYNYYDEDFTPPNLTKYQQIQYRRTVAGLSKDGKTLILYTADGPLHSKEAAELMIELHGYKALLLDSGGSSTFYMEGRGNNGIMNHPSDGSERFITDALGIFYTK